MSRIHITLTPSGPKGSGRPNDGVCFVRLYGKQGTNATTSDSLLCETYLPASGKTVTFSGKTSQAHSFYISGQTIGNTASTVTGRTNMAANSSTEIYITLSYGISVGSPSSAYLKQLPVKTSSGMYKLKKLLAPHVGVKYITNNVISDDRYYKSELLTSSTQTNWLLAKGGATNSGVYSRVLCPCPEEYFYKRPNTFWPFDGKYELSSSMSRLVSATTTSDSGKTIAVNFKNLSGGDPTGYNEIDLFILFSDSASTLCEYALFKMSGWTASTTTEQLFSRKIYSKVFNNSQANHAVMSHVFGRARKTQTFTLYNGLTTGVTIWGPWTYLAGYGGTFSAVTSATYGTIDGNYLLLSAMTMQSIYISYSTTLKNVWEAPKDYSTAYIELYLNNYEELLSDKRCSFSLNAVHQYFGISLSSTVNAKLFDMFTDAGDPSTRNLDFTIRIFDYTYDTTLTISPTNNTSYYIYLDNYFAIPDDFVMEFHYPSPIYQLFLTKLRRTTGTYITPTNVMTVNMGEYWQIVFTIPGKYYGCLCNGFYDTDKGYAISSKYSFTAKPDTWKIAYESSPELITLYNMEEDTPSPVYASTINLEDFNSYTFEEICEEYDLTPLNMVNKLCSDPSHGAQKAVLTDNTFTYQGTTYLVYDLYFGNSGGWEWTGENNTPLGLLLPQTIDLATLQANSMKTNTSNRYAPFVAVIDTDGQDVYLGGISGNLTYTVLDAESE